MAASCSNFERFMKNLAALNFSRGEIQEILEMLSCVILLFEIKFVGSSFVVAGSGEYTEWAPRHRSALQKLCKLLVVSEERFLEIFQGIQHRGEVENKLRELSRALYSITFEWVVMKVNARLQAYAAGLMKQRLDRCKPVQRKEEQTRITGLYTISLVDFPGFHKIPSLGGFTANLAFECLNLFVADKLVGLLHSLNSDKISMNILSPPISKELVAVLMSKESGLLQSLDLESFDRYWKEFRLSHKDSEYISTSQNSISVKYTWGEIEYDINLLRQQAIKFTHHSEFNTFFNRCSNPLLKRLVNTEPLSISDMFRKDISVLIGPLVSYENSIVYFIKASKQGLEYGETIRVLRNTLVIPSLIWEWYGYRHWVSNASLMANLSAESNNVMQAQRFVSSLLSKILAPGEFLVGLKFSLLKEQAFKKINEKSKESQKKIAGKIAEASFDAFSPKNQIKFVRATSSKILNTTGALFDFTVHGEKPYTESGIHEYLDPMVDINDMSFKKENLSKLSSKLSKSSSTMSIKEPFQTVQSKKHFRTLKSSASNFRLFNYDEHLSSIIAIQGLWRGHRARKYFKAYQLLHSSAIRIQASWKAYKHRQMFVHIREQVCKIQRFCKKILGKKNQAALVIQKWFKNHQKKIQEEVSRNLSSIASTISDPEYPVLHTAKRSLLKPSKTPSDQGTYKPAILNYSRILAKQRETKLGNTDLPVEKRLEKMHLIKKNKIDGLRKSKIEEERENLTMSPNINKSQEFSTSFLQRQELKSQQIKMRRDLEYLKKQAEESSGLTFKPSLCRLKPNRSVERSIKDLHAWAELKKAELSRAQKAKAESEARSLSPFILSNRSKKILQQREKKINENTKIMNEYKDTVLAYWPNQVVDNN